MRTCVVPILLMVFMATRAGGQPTMGLLLQTPQSEIGYTLFAPIASQTTYLIDNCGEFVHSWTSGYTANLSAYLLEDGSLLRAGRIPGPGGGTGVVEMLDWDGNVMWSYSPDAGLGSLHHDIEPLPNGNILMVATEDRTQTEVIQAGSMTNLAAIQSEQILEVKPDLVNGGGTIVWAWRPWDHLIQDKSSAKDNFGIVADHPERIDINFLNHQKADWLHVNGVAYHPGLDQIMISVHNFSEFWVIDHSTTLDEAAGSVGGDSGHGGDLLYRWGNPRSYDQGGPADQKLYLQHHAHWIPDGVPGGGRVLVFNNQAGTPTGLDYSTVNEVSLPVNPDGAYVYSGGAFGPDDSEWTYQADPPTSFYSAVISGAQRLSSGNTLICEGETGRFFEVTPSGEVVWTYINPVTALGPQTQGDPIQGNNTFRCTRYAPDYPGLAGHDLVPMGPIETGSTYSCDLSTAVPDPGGGQLPALSVYPNPVRDLVHLSVPDGPVFLRIYRVDGRLVWASGKEAGQTDLVIPVRDWMPGTYMIQLSAATGNQYQKLLVGQ